MFSLLNRAIAGLHRRFVLLAPRGAAIPPAMRRTFDDLPGYERFVGDIQRLRGRVYVADGALRPTKLTRDGRHRSPEDEQAWHLVTVDDDGCPNACVWYRNHQNPLGLDQLRVRRCPLAVAADSRDRLRRAVESEILRARRQRLQYAEIGGWAVSEESRRSPDGIVLALAVYALGRLLGGSLGITTATVRHSSATILRKLGGTSLDCDGAPIPSYFDPDYRCEMELLRFDSRYPGSRFGPAVDFLEAQLPLMTVLAPPALVGVPATERPSYTAGTFEAVALSPA